MNATTRVLADNWYGVTLRRLDRRAEAWDRLQAALDLVAGDENVRAGLQARFRGALIDEFQDTDDTQWRLFGTLFGSPSHLLVTVGDPKQAIYSFRGGDIHTYLAARSAEGVTRLCYCTLRTVTKRTERTFESLRYPFGGDHPSQTTHQTMSSLRS